MVKELSGHRTSDGSALRASNDLSQVMSILVNRHANIGDVIHKQACYCTEFFEQ